MDRDEKIARLEKWLVEYDKRQKRTKTEQLRDNLTDEYRDHRTVLAVLRRLKDEKAMERLGIFRGLFRD